MLTYDPQRWGSIAEFAADARAEYHKDYQLYQDFCTELERLVKGILAHDRIVVQQVTARPKTLDSFERKAAKPNATDPMMPKYAEPSLQIEDKAGIRIICYYVDQIEAISVRVLSQFTVTDTVDKIAALRKDQKLGYASLHHIVMLDEVRAAQPEYEKFAGMKAEMQIRTVLQHAWAEIEHDRYKALTAADDQVSRSFILMAGLIELADQEFLRLRNLADQANASAKRAVVLSQPIMLSAAALKELVQVHWGESDAESDVFEAAVQLLGRLGFVNVDTLTACLAGAAASAQFRSLAVEYPDPVIRLYIAAALSVGTDRFRHALQAEELSSASGWGGLLSAIDGVT